MTLNKLFIAEESSSPQPRNYTFTLPATDEGENFPQVASDFSCAIGADEDFNAETREDLTGSPARDGSGTFEGTAFMLLG